MEWTQLVLFLFVLMTVQAIGTYVQVKVYRKAVRRLHRRGNVGIGSRRGRLRPGCIVIIACDQDGNILAGEILKGFTIFNGFRTIDGIVGKTIYDLSDEYKALPYKEQKHYTAHLQALDALHLRLAPAA